MAQSTIVSLLDRKIALPVDGSAIPIYELCRSWVQNNPELDQLRPLPQMPTQPPAPSMCVPDEQPPLFPLDTKDMDAEDALHHFKDHWVAVRQHHQAMLHARQACVAPRLQALLANPPNAPMLPLPAVIPQPLMLPQQMAPFVMHSSLPSRPGMQVAGLPMGFSHMQGMGGADGGAGHLLALPVQQGPIGPGPLAPVITLAQGVGTCMPSAQGPAAGAT